MRLGLVIGLALGAVAGVARGENLVATLGADRIAIRSNFTGAPVSLFGVIEPDPETPRAGAYDAVVSVRGPRGSVSVWEKERLGPFWLNLDQRKYIAIPSFIAVQSSRAIAEMASATTAEDLRLGVANLIPEQSSSRRANDPDFRQALERIRRVEGLFFSNSSGVRFLTPLVFQTRIDIPGRAPLGGYDVDIAVVVDGVLAARKSLTFSVEKSGVEAAFAIAAKDEPVIYGLATALLAVVVGLLAAFAFDRE